MPNSLSRKDNHRRSLLRNLATSLILYEEIKTTKPKGMEVKPIVERLINMAKKNDLNAHRRLLGFLFDKKAVQKTFEVLVPRYAKVKSGFIRIYNLSPRLGDNAAMVVVKLTPELPSKVKELPNNKDQNASKEKSKAGQTKQDSGRDAKTKK